MSGDDEKPKGVDISQLGKVNADNDDQSAPVRRIVDRAAQLSVGGRALQEALRGLGGVSALAESTRAASSVTLLKDQLTAVTACSDPIELRLVRSSAQPHLGFGSFSGWGCAGRGRRPAKIARFQFSGSKIGPSIAEILHRLTSRGSGHPQGWHMEGDP